MRTALDTRILDLIATVIECCEPPPEPAPGHSPTQTVRVLATLRRFLRKVHALLVAMLRGNPAETRSVGG